MAKRKGDVCAFGWSDGRYMDAGGSVGSHQAHVCKVITDGSDHVHQCAGCPATK